MQVLYFHCIACHYRFYITLSSCPYCNSENIKLKPFPRSIFGKKPFKIKLLKEGDSATFDIFFSFELRLYSGKKKPACRAFISSCEFTMREVDCAICMENFRHKVISFECGHSFHALCALKWLKIRNTSPICRIVLFESEIKYY